MKQVKDSGQPDGDTLLFKFTFISDSIQDTLDGLMFDNFIFADYAEGIIEIQNNNNLIISPNPFTTTTQITLPQTCHHIALEVYDIHGKRLSQQDYYDCSQIQFNRIGLNNGMYFVKLTMDEKWVETAKVMVSE